MSRTKDPDGANAAQETDETVKASMADACRRIAHAPNENGIGRTDAVVE
jgi:hypothetical protein